MVKTIWKYELAGLYAHFEFSIPQGAKLIAVHPQRGTPCVWFEVDPTTRDADYEPHVFALVGTGHSVPDGFNHVGTVLMLADNLVLHVYHKVLGKTPT